MTSPPSNDPPPESQLPAELLERLYDDLRRLAAGLLRRERDGHTLQPTALAHEAWMRLHDQRGLAGADRPSFLAAASVAIRRILVDHARAKGAAKRGGAWSRVEVDLPGDESLAALDLLALDEALAELAELSPRQARVVELRFFGGLAGDETAAALEISPRTVDNDWKVARAWLGARLGGARD